MSVTIFVCDTCAYSSDEKVHEGKSGGEWLADSVEACARSHPDLTVRRHSCLMGCDRHCNVALSSDGKITYVLGRFEPTEDAAAAIVEYAGLYAASETGVVPYKQWPLGVKGHFVARIPAIGGLVSKAD